MHRVRGASPASNQAEADGLSTETCRDKLASLFKVELPVSLSYDYPTPRELADHLAKPAKSAIGARGGQDLGIQAMVDELRRIIVEALGSSVQSSQPFMEVRGAVSKCLARHGWPLNQSTDVMQMGVDSIGMMELRQSVNDGFGVNLPATALYDYPTTLELAQHLKSQSGRKGMSEHPGLRLIDQTRRPSPSPTVILSAACRLPGDPQINGGGYACMCIVSAPTQNCDRSIARCGSRGRAATTSRLHRPYDGDTLVQVGR